MLRSCVLALVLTPALALPAAAQTADEVVARNLKARGGLEKLKSVESVRMSGKALLGPELEAPFTLEGKRPNRRRFEFTMRGETGVQAFDGTTAWVIVPMGGRSEPQQLPEELAKKVGEDSDLDGPLVDYQAKGHSVELLGKEKLDDGEVYKLKLTLKGGGVRHVYIDAATGLERRVVGQGTAGNNQVEFESNLSDYREVGGLMLPYVIDQGPPGARQRQKITIEKIELNVPIDDARFKLPKPESKPSPAPTP